jgi:hypothetical protein
MPDEPVETTLEMARRCPKCQQPGVFAGSAPARTHRQGVPTGIQRGTQLHTFICGNERCRWHNTVCRIVQVNPDGSIPAPTVRRDRQYPQVPDLTAQVNAAVEAQLAAEVLGGAEIGRRV